MEFYEICPCGRTFVQPGALNYHKRSCSYTKKRLSQALEKAKEAWTSRKRMRLSSHESVQTPQGSNSVPTNNLQGFVIAIDAEVRGFSTYNQGSKVPDGSYSNQKLSCMSK